MSKLESTARDLGGRPSKRTEAIVKVFLDCLARGLPQGHAARAAGLSTQTVLNWKNESEQFKEQCDQALAQGLDARLRVIEEASKIDWRAACWWCEHVLPQHFSKSRLEITGADGAPLAAGVKLYLPQKQQPVIETDEPGDRLALPAKAETRSDGEPSNGGEPEEANA